MLAYALIQSRFLRHDFARFWQIKAIGIWFGTLLIPVLFYTYNGAFGTSPDWVNVLIFFISAAAAYALETWCFLKDEKSVNMGTAVFARVVLFLIALAFVLCTFLTPRIPLFQDPISGLYGIV